MFANCCLPLLWFPLPTEALLFVCQHRFLKPESMPLEQSKKKPTLGWHYGGDTLVFLQYFLTRASKYTGWPGTSMFPAPAFLHRTPQLPVLPTALTQLHPRTLATPSPRREGSFQSRRRELGAFTQHFWGCTPISSVEISFRSISAAGTPATMY